MFEMLRRRESAAQEAAPAPEESAATGTADAAPPAPVLDAQGRAHDPATGKFLPAADPDAPAAAPVDETADPAAAPAPQGTVRIQLPEGHSLRDQGLEFIDALPEQERALRALLNSDTRRREVEEVRKENLRLRAQVEARNAFVDTPADPALAAKIEAIREVDPDLADMLAYAERTRRAQALQQAEEQQFQTLEQAEFEQQAQAAVSDFQARAVDTVRSYLPAEWVQSPAFDTAFRQAMYEYGNELEFAELQGRPVQYDLNAFVRRFNAVAQHDAQLQQWINTERQQREAAERERIAEEARKAAEAAAAERERERLTALTQRHSTRNRIGEIPGQVRTDQLSTAPETVDYSKLPVADLRRTLKQEARQTAGSLFKR